MPRKHCSKDNKPSFPNELEANLAIADIQRSNSHNRHRKFREEPTRSYPCGTCQGWHITSQLDRESLTA